MDRLTLTGINETAGPVLVSQPPADDEITGNRSLLDVDKISNSGVRFIDQITAFPNRIREFGDGLNEDLIKIANRITGDGGAAAERNLKGGAIARYSSRAGAWLTQPKNALIAVAAVVGLIFLIRRV